MNEGLIYEVKESAAFLTINREAKRNALNQEMITSFLEHLDRAGEDESVRVVCVTGAGERAFCAGADLAVTLSREGDERLSGMRRYAELIKKMSRFEKPLVARVNGSCLAGGLGVMLSCDIVISRNDISFWTPEVNVGIFPMVIGALLFRNVGRKKAMDMVLTARKIPAAEAEIMGLISRAVEPDRLDQEIQNTIKLLVSKSPIGVRIGKEAFRTMGEMPFEEAIDYLCEALGRVIGTEDAAEGMQAFLEKREPHFKGR